TTPIDEDDAFDDLTAHRLDRGDHREEGAAGGQDVVDEQDPLARHDPEAAPEFAVGRAVVGANLLGEDAADTKLPSSFVGEDDPAGRRPRDQVDQQLAIGRATVLGEEPAQLAGRGRILEDLELLDVRVTVTPALEQEVPL